MGDPEALLVYGGRTLEGGAATWFHGLSIDVRGVGLHARPFINAANTSTSTLAPPLCTHRLPTHYSAAPKQ